MDLNKKNINNCLYNFWKIKNFHVRSNNNNNNNDNNNKLELGTLVFGPTEQVPDSIFQQINEEMIKEAALKTKGSGGPSGVDSNQPLLRYCYYEEKAMQRVCGSPHHRSYSS